MRALIDKATRLLRWSEAYMKTDMVYLAKGSFWLSAGQVASTLAGLALVVAYANLLPKDVYGSYKFVLSIAGIIAVFTLTGMDVAVTQAVARGSEGTFRTGFRVQLKWNLLMVLAGAIGAIYYGLNGNRTLAICLLIVGALSPIIESASLYGAFLSGKREFKFGSACSIFRSLATAASLIVTMLLTRDLILIVLAYFLSHAVTTAAIYLLVLKKYRPSDTPDHSVVNYGKHISVTNAISVIASHFDKVLVFHYLGAAGLATYGIAFSIPSQLKIAMKMISSLAFPKMSAASLQTIRSAINQKSMRIFIGFSALIILYIFAAPYLYRLFFPLYLEAVPFSQALALGYAFAPAILYSQALFALKLQKEIYIFKIGSSLMRILLIVALLPPFGIWGAVYAYFLANAFSFLLSIFLFRRLRE